MIKKPTLKQCEWMTQFSPGTRGYADDMQLILLLLVMMENHGFGRVPQLATWIESVWNGQDISKEKKSMLKNRKELKKYWDDQQKRLMDIIDAQV